MHPLFPLELLLKCLFEDIFFICCREREFLNVFVYNRDYIGFVGSIVILSIYPIFEEVKGIQDKCLFNYRFQLGLYGLVESAPSLVRDAPYKYFFGEIVEFLSPKAEQFLPLVRKDFTGKKGNAVPFGPFLFRRGNRVGQEYGVVAFICKGTYKTGPCLGVGQGNVQFVAIFGLDAFFLGCSGILFHHYTLPFGNRNLKTILVLYCGPSLFVEPNHYSPTGLVEEPYSVSYLH